MRNTVIKREDQILVDFTVTLQSEGESITATKHMEIIKWLAQHCNMTYVSFLSSLCLGAMDSIHPVLPWYSQEYSSL